MSSSYCSSCKIELQNDDSIREHYKSEIHRYNIKRKLVGLPPVSIDQFSKKKAQLVAESSQSERDQAIRCELCSKSFASKGTYKQHLESKKHRENLKKFNRKGKEGGSAEEQKEEKSDSTTAEDQTVCLFCNKQNSDIDENLVHMRLAHSFFISEWKHLKDLQGLLKYLGEKIHKRGMCFSCDYTVARENRLGESVQNHMLDKQHIFMNTEDFEEYERFYDFSRVVQDLRKKNLIVDGSDIVMEEDEYMEVDVPVEEEREDGDDWEVIEGEGDAQIKHNKDKTYKLRTAKLLDSGEIQLPNGSILGHRRFRNTYKQYYRESARQSQAENGALEFFDEKVLAARQEENRLTALNDELIRQERRKVEAQVHKVNVRKDREALKLSMHANKIQQYFRKQLN